MSLRTPPCFGQLNHRWLGAAGKGAITLNSLLGIDSPRAHIPQYCSACGQTRVARWRSGRLDPVEYPPFKFALLDNRLVRVKPGAFPGPRP